jgi:hypothetical protein
MTPVRRLGELITNGCFVCCLCLSWITLNSTLRITATRLCAMQVSWWHTVMQLRMAHLRTTACDTQISLWRTVVQQRMAPQSHAAACGTPWWVRHLGASALEALLAHHPSLYMHSTLCSATQHPSKAGWTHGSTGSELVGRVGRVGTHLYSAMALHVRCTLAVYAVNYRCML